MESDPHSFQPLLRLLQLASPALPVGGFSYSEGIEAAVAHQWVHDEASAQSWLIDHLHLVQSRSELPVIAQAIPAWQRHDAPQLKQLNDWVIQTRETYEMRLQSEQMGRSLLIWLRNQANAEPLRMKTCEDLPPTWPLALALALSTDGISIRQGLVAAAFGWAENMVQAAIKAVPLGQLSGQRILATLAIEIPSAVDHAMQMTAQSRQSFSPRLAILSARHETQYSRLFRS